MTKQFVIDYYGHDGKRRVSNVIRRKRKIFKRKKRKEMKNILIMVISRDSKR